MAHRATLRRGTGPARPRPAGSSRGVGAGSLSRAPRGRPALPPAAALASEDGGGDLFGADVFGDLLEGLEGQTAAGAPTGEMAEWLAGEPLGEEDAKRRLLESTKAIREYGRRKEPLKAVKELQLLLLEEGVAVDCIAATAAVEACVANGRTTLAQRVFDECFAGEGGLEADERAYSALVRGHGMANPPSWSAVSMVVERMRDGGVPVTALTYNTILKVCVHQNDIERGLDVIDRMVSAGVQPDGMTAEVVKRKKPLRTSLRRSFPVF